jgi:hypothetical protein
MKIVCAILQAVGAVGFTYAAAMVAAPLGVAVGSVLIFASGVYLEHR